MSTAKWSAPGSEVEIGGNALNSLANTSTSARMAYNNSVNRDLYARVVVELGSISPGSGASITLRYLGRRSGVDETITTGLESYTLPLGTAVGTKRLIFEMVRIYPFDGGFVVTNNSGTTLPASGNAVYVQPFNEDIV